VKSFQSDLEGTLPVSWRPLAACRALSLDDTGGLKREAFCLGKWASVHKGSTYFCACVFTFSRI